MVRPVRGSVRVGLGGRYLSSPLWYLRVLLWLLVLSPVLLASFRRRPAIALGLPVLALAVLEWVGRHPNWAVPWLPDLVWQAGDVALYAIFLMLGFAHRDGRLDGLGTRRWLTVAGVSALGAAGWIITQPVPGMVVNNSHPAHLLVGLAWLGVVMAGREWLDRMARAPRAGAAVAWVTQRTMTTYLWHAAALVITRHALGRPGELPAGVWSVGLVAGTAAVMTLLVLAFGWVEDLAGGRPTLRGAPRRPDRTVAVSGAAPRILGRAPPCSGQAGRPFEEGGGRAPGNQFSRPAKREAGQEREERGGGDKHGQTAAEQHGRRAVMAVDHARHDHEHGKAGDQNHHDQREHQDLPHDGI